MYYIKNPQMFRAFNDNIVLSYKHMLMSVVLTGDNMCLNKLIKKHTLR